MHFFTDPTRLPTQTNTQTYGPLAAADEYRVGAEFTQTQVSPAFACQDGQLLVVEAATTGLVNIFLKPSATVLNIGLGRVVYYVYRGLSRSSFADNTNPANLRAKGAAGNSDLLNQVWQDFDANNAERQKKGQPALPQPRANNIIFSNDPANPTLNPTLEACFARQQTLPPLVVREGMSLGDFAVGTISFEVIIDTYGLTLDLIYAQQSNTTVQVTGLSQLALAARRDSVLSYLDPAAFFGLHTGVGLQQTTYQGAYPGGIKQTQKLTGNNVSTAITKLATAHRGYIDVRSEYGRSYNFTGSYGDSSNNILSLAGTLRNYETSNWPIAWVELANTSTTLLNLQLRLDDNPAPTLYCAVGNYQRSNTANPGKDPGKDYFIPASDLGSLTAWTPDLPFYFTGTTASYLKLNFYRPGLNLSLSSNKVLQRQHRFDNLFDLTLQPTAATSARTVPQAVAHEPLLAGHNTPPFNSYLVESGVFASSDRVMLYVRERRRLFPKPQASQYPARAAATTSTGLFGADKAGFLSEQVSLVGRRLPAAPAGAQAADIVAFSGTPHYLDSLVLLGLSASEWQLLGAVPNLSPFHPKYVVFTDVTPIPALTDECGIAYQQYELSVQGLLDGNTGVRATHSPATPVIVYASAAPNGGFVLMSTQFAIHSLPVPVVYNLNAEETWGENDYDSSATPKETIVDHFYSKKDSLGKADIKVAVDSFLGQIGRIDTNTSNYIGAINALVATVGRALFSAGMARIQADYNSNSSIGPDDRPLYWGRIKVIVALKRHPVFANTLNLESKIAPGTASPTSTGGVIKRSSLDIMLKLLEETSRNYTNLVFPTGAKRILVTGFDPFRLDRNPYQMNPSGIAAAATHGTHVANANVQVMIFPVRWSDFETPLGAYAGVIGNNEGIVEQYIEPLLTQDLVDMVLTISLDANTPLYQVEKYATATRTQGFPDNLGRNSTRSRSIDPPVVAANGDNLEWLQTTLPDAMYKPKLVLPGNAESVLDVSFVQLGSPSTPRKNIRMERGSGGDYLSNEIFYRVGRIRELKQRVQTAIHIPTGHLHIPGTPATRTNDTDDPKRVPKKDPFDSQDFRALGVEVANIIRILTAGAAVL